MELERRKKKRRLKQIEGIKEKIDTNTLKNNDTTKRRLEEEVWALSGALQSLLHITH